VVMGLAGLALAWQRAVPLMGELAGAIALVLAALAGTVFAALALATLLRAQRHPGAWAEDRRHPVRHTLIATLPVSVILLATCATALFGPQAPARALWWAGAAGQLFITWWVLTRWWRGQAGGGLAWAGLTPALVVPVVGNVLVPLAGVPLGQAEWAAAQFGVGALFWPVVLVLLLARVAQQGPWPERLLPSTAILIAPPAVIGLAALQLGAAPVLAWMAWGIALFTAAWVGALARRIAAQPFGIGHWALSFPLAALAALTLQLATPGGGALAVLAPLLLAVASLVVLALALATVRGLRDGSLLAPEPVATIAPVAG